MKNIENDIDEDIEKPCNNPKSFHYFGDLLVHYNNIKKKLNSFFPN